MLIYVEHVLVYLLFLQFVSFVYIQLLVSICNMTAYVPLLGLVFLMFYNVVHLAL